MKVLENTKSKINKDKNGENVRHLKITEIILAYCNIVTDNYQHDSKVLNKFNPNKTFGLVLFLKTFNTEFFIY